jgi:hypothetical protein
VADCLGRGLYVCHSTVLALLLLQGFMPITYFRLQENKSLRILCLVRYSGVIWACTVVLSLGVCLSSFSKFVSTSFICYSWNNKSAFICSGLDKHFSLLYRKGRIQNQEIFIVLSHIWYDVNKIQQFQDNYYMISWFLDYTAICRSGIEFEKSRISA